VLGQALGLPLVMAAFSFVGLAVTSATVSIFGTAVSDPLEVVARMSGLAPLGERSCERTKNILFYFISLNWALQ
jgi:cytosine/uracil/thiamine/allantoin permease